MARLLITTENLREFKDAYKLGYVEGWHDFVNTNRIWWVPSVEKKLFANRDSIHKAMLLASTMEDHKLLLDMYNVMLHPWYSWGEWTRLEEWTDYVFDWFVTTSENSSLPLDKSAVKALVSRPGPAGNKEYKKRKDSCSRSFSIPCLKSIIPSSIFFPLIQELNGVYSAISSTIMLCQLRIFIR